VPALVARIKELGAMPPEDFRVARMAAISLGRMKAKEALPILRGLGGARLSAHDPFSWAAGQILGEPLAAPETTYKVRRDWFLTPLE
jgi:hypothetical protein